MKRWLGHSLVLAGGGAWLPIAGGACGARARNVAAQASPHVDPDAGPIAWLTNPPSSGPHWAHAPEDLCAHGAYP